MSAYYNENDEFMVAWLRELMKRGVIAPGVVDGRSIKEVRVEDLKGFTQCHFFAGCGVWSYALRQAGWQDDWPCWTGSCPCQPFSVSGKRQGASDGRHLYPVWGKLIEVARPVVIFGEQVASDDGLAWIDFVQAHLERQAYTVGTVDLCSAGFGAPHARQRLYFVADSGSESGCTEHEHESGRRGASQPGNTAKPRRGGADGELADSEDSNRGSGERGTQTGTRPVGERRRGPASGGEAGHLVESERLRCDPGKSGDRRGQKSERGATGEVVAGPGVVGGGTLADAGTGLIPDARRGPEGRTGIIESGETGDLGISECAGLERHSGDGGNGDESGRLGAIKGGSVTAASAFGDLGDTSGRGRGMCGSTSGDSGRPTFAGFTNGFWANAEWLWCRDGKFRPVPRAVESFVESLAPGVAADLGLVRLRHYPGHQDTSEEVLIFAPLVAKGKKRVGRLRGYGNALTAEVAKEFIKAYLEVSS